MQYNFLSDREVLRLQFTFDTSWVHKRLLADRGAWPLEKVGKLSQRLDGVRTGKEVCDALAVAMFDTQKKMQNKRISSTQATIMRMYSDVALRNIMDEELADRLRILIEKMIAHENLLLFL